MNDMNDYILLMHNDVPNRKSVSADAWAAYFTELRQRGNFEGGSAIGDGICVSKSDRMSDITLHLSGYIRIRADNLNHARELVIGNPVYEAGGTVEIRELTKG